MKEVDLISKLNQPHLRTLSVDNSVTFNINKDTVINIGEETYTGKDLLDVFDIVKKIKKIYPELMVI